MDDEVVAAAAHDLERAVGRPRHAVLAVGPEADRLALHERDAVEDGAVLLGQREERAVVEHRAVLVDLDERGALVLRGGAQHVGHVVAVAVDGPGGERRPRAERQRERVERLVLRAERGRLRDLAELGGRRRLALREPVDLVVEHQDLQRHVAAQRVDQVVAADRQRVAVAGHHPDREVVARGREPGRQRRSAAVDAVHPVGVHVVGEAPRAADAGHEDDACGGIPSSGISCWTRRARRSRRSPGTSASPGRRRSPSWSARPRDVREANSQIGASSHSVPSQHSSITLSSSAANSGLPSNLVWLTTLTGLLGAQDLRALAGVHRRDELAITRCRTSPRLVGAGARDAGARSRGRDR